MMKSETEYRQIVVTQTYRETYLKIVKRRKLI